MKTITRNLLLLVALMSCGSSSDNNELMAQTMTQKLYITIGGVTKPATLVDNAATQELVARLQRSPVTLSLDTNGNFEIWGPLGFSLPTSNQQITAKPGDIILYSGSNICLFCGSNSWSYTRLGHIDDMTEAELRTFLRIGESDIIVTLSISNPSGIRQVNAEEKPSSAYTLLGTQAHEGTKGFVVKNGKVEMK
ncbi:MAG: hypothetical protein IJK42_10525 [Prevotella sp.]|nr:hypothetical protein [Prevotella sp.]